MRVPLLLWIAAQMVSAWAAPGDLKWKKELSQHAAAPVLTHSGDVVVWDGAGKVYCFSPGGSNLWQFTAVGDSNFAPTVASDGLVLIPASKLYALDPDGGALRWEFDPQIRFSTWGFRFKTPTIGPDGAIYIPTFAARGEGRLYALNADGTKRWELPGDFSAPLSILPTGKLVSRKDFYFGVINPDGQTAWELLYGYPHHEPPALTSEGDIILHLSGPSMNSGFIQKFSPTGLQQWSYDSGSTPSGAAAIGADGRMYVAHYSGKVTALSASGQFLWNYEITDGPDYDRILSGPAVGSDNTIYFTANGTLYALDAQGQKLWSAASGLPVALGPLIGPDGAIYFTALDRNGAACLAAVEGNAPGLAKSSWPMFMRSPQHDASLAVQMPVPAPPTNLTASVDLYSDRIKLQWPSGEGAVYYHIYRQEDAGGQALIASNITGTAFYDDRTAQPGVDYTYSIRSLNSAGLSDPSSSAMGRRSIAQIGQPVWVFPTGGAIRGYPAMADDGNVYAGSSDGHVYALDPRGLLRWKFGFGGSTISSISLGPDGTVYFTAGSRRNPWDRDDRFYHLYAFRPDGEMRWKLPLQERLASSLSIGADGTVYLVDGGILAVSPAGQILWSLNLETVIDTPPTVSFGGRLYAATRAGELIAISPAGEVLWRSAVGDSWLRSPLHDSRGLLYFGGVNLHSYHPDGQRRWMIPTVYGGAGPAFLDAQDTLYAYMDQYLVAYNTNRVPIWKTFLGGFTGAGFAHDQQGTIYANVGAQMAALNARGEKLWEFALSSHLSAGPVLGRTNVALVGSENGGLYALRISAPLGVSAWPESAHDTQNNLRADVLKPLSPTALAPGVNATDRTRVTDVQIGWGSVVGAEEYSIHRSETSDSATATQISVVRGRLSFLDKLAVPEKPYFYWVKAHNAVSATSLSGPDEGTRRQAVAGELLETWEVGGRTEGPPVFGTHGEIYVSTSAIPLQDPPNAPGVLSLHSDGRVLWRRNLPVQEVTPPSQAEDGTLYVGTVITTFQAPIPPSPVYAVGPDGTVRWEFLASSGVAGTPAIDFQGNVCFGSVDGKIYCISPSGVQRGSYDTGSNVSSPVTIGPDGAIYAFAQNGFVYALDPSGSLRWSARVAYLSSGGHLEQSLSIDQQSTLYASPYPSGIVALNIDGLPRWRTGEALSYYPALIAENGMVIGAAGDGQVRAFDSAGTNLWALQLGESIGGIPGMTTNSIYVSTSGGRLLSISKSGQIGWQLLTGSPLRHVGIGPDGTIYVGSDDGKLRSVYGVEPQAPGQWTGYQRDERHTGRQTGSVPALESPTALAATVNVYNDRIALNWTSAPGAWYYEIWRAEGTNLTQLTKLTNVSAANVYLDFSAAEGMEYSYSVRGGYDDRVSAFGPTAVGRRRVALPGEYVGEATFVGLDCHGLALAEDTLVAGVDGGLYGFDLELRQRWRVSEGTLSYGIPTVSSSNIFVSRNDGRAFAFDHQGNRVWSTGLVVQSFSAPFSVGADGTLYNTASAGRRLMAITPSGQVKWEKALQANTGQPPLVAPDGTIYTPLNDQTLAAFSPQGEELWRLPLPARVLYQPALGGDGTIYWPGADRRLYAISPQGTILWSFLPSLSSSLAGVSIGPDSTIYVGSTGSSVFALQPEGSRKWEFKVEGNLTRAPSVAADGSIFFATTMGRIYGLSSAGALLWRTNTTVGGVRDYLLLPDGRLILAGTRKIAAIRTGKTPAHFPWPMAYQNAGRTSRLPMKFDPGLAPYTTIYSGDLVQFNPRFAGIDPIEVRLREGTNLLLTSTVTNLPLVWRPVKTGTNHFVVELIDQSGLRLSSYVPVLSKALILGTVNTPSNLTLRVQGPLAGLAYTLEQTSDLLQWSAPNVPAIVTSTNVSWTFDKPFVEEPSRFFRVRSSR